MRRRERRDGGLHGRSVGGCTRIRGPSSTGIANDTDAGVLDVVCNIVVVADDDVGGVDKDITVVAPPR